MNLSSRPHRNFLASALVLALLVGPFSSSYALLDKTRFVAHLGAAYYAFHHWVLRPYQQGKFTAGAPGRTGGLVKGGLALLFAAHEVKVAENIAHKSRDPLLQKLDAGLAKLNGSFANVGQNLKAGRFDPQQITQLDQSTSALGETAAAGGTTIKDVKVPVF